MGTGNSAVDGEKDGMTPGSRARTVHDIVRFRTRIIEAGTLGRIVEVDDHGPACYTMQFELRNLNGATITVPHLTEYDVKLA
ncbi:hypothetical protein [Nakamurella multipartita]|jgi:hypothetical protein|uniref:DUF4926 domain-containing protein n=1 Tax=Nakamurella multipartita (strain ATCC 700099 / DSM 44233 / CIP 104796 / JCM 9543 / NBRC 105858 / Y-104) TaxID=479431 RepID=C8X7F5_NAKMY|nr:hypothetical protein [Nakamurella multipartita]ACV78908.1 hypothetical protein Namu_2550 [Nakamurella multipartita DSM 44233]